MQRSGRVYTPHHQLQAWEKRNLKITHIETVRVGELPDIIWVRIHTDTGLIGLGESWYAASTMETAVHDHFAPLLVGNELYIVSDYGIVTCVDAVSGDLHWQQRIGGNYSASPVFADGRIYFQSEEGKTTVVRPGIEYEVLATNQLDGSTLASMAVSEGALFLRSSTHLYRIGDPGTGTAAPRRDIFGHDG